MVYCDHNSSSPLRPQSREAMLRALSLGANASSVHGAGRAARAVIDDARATIAQFAGAGEGRVIFTSGASEANSLALWGAVEGAIADSDNAVRRITRLFVAGIEHSSVLKTADHIAERSAGLRVEHLPVTAGGVLDTESLRVALREGKGRALVAVMAANNETGAIQPLEEVSRLVREHGDLLLVDAVAAAGKMTLNAALCDYMTLSAHKLGGPQGSGALIVGDGAPFAAQLLGGGQEKGLRAGTENLSGIAGFAAAAQALAADRDEEGRVTAIRDRFESLIQAELPQAVIFAKDAPRLGNTCHFAIPGLAAETMLATLDLEGIMLSAGSACSSGLIAPSHVLAAMGVDDGLVRSALRASFGWNSSIDDAERTAAALAGLALRTKARVAA